LSSIRDAISQLRVGRPRLPINGDVLGLYVILAIGLLGPLASDTILPRAVDHANHTAFIVEARHALEEGQFPLRVAPFAQFSLRYPLFQFYSQTPYVLAGAIHKYLTPDNPWLALKVSYLAGLCLAGFFVFKAGQLLGFDRATSVLTGVVYITAPYLLINIHARGTYTEAFAECVLPLLAYSSIRLIQRRQPVDVLTASLSWFILGTSHLITFVFGTMFYLLLVACLLTFRCIKLRSAAILVVACVLGWGLSAFQWYPAATIAPLRIHQGMGAGTVFYWHWLTPLSSMLSLTSNPPEPLGGRLNTYFLHPAIGVPILVGVIGVTYLHRFLASRSSEVWICLALFFIAFLGAWSPVNFWDLLPAQFQIVQFPYRLLTFTDAFGTILFAYFAWVYRRRENSPGFLISLVVLILLAGPYLPMLPQNDRALSDIVARPEANYGTDAYEFAGAATLRLEGVRSYADALPYCAVKGDAVTCDLNGPAFVQLPMLYYPSLLRVTINGKTERYRASLDKDRRVVSVFLRPGQNHVVGRFVGSAVGNAVSGASAALALVLLLGWRAAKLRLKPPRTEAAEAQLRRQQDSCNADRTGRAKQAVNVAGGPTREAPRRPVSCSAQP
jgi:uncharacterized membrane protein (UPF0136 family)